MTLVIGILGAAGLFALFAFSASRDGTRLERAEGCQRSLDSTDSCVLEGECDGCGHTNHGSGWWPGDGVKDGD